MQIHQDLRARYSVAMHWGTFVLTDEPLDEPPHRLAAARRAAGYRRGGLLPDEARRDPQARAADAPASQPQAEAVAVAMRDSAVERRAVRQRLQTRTARDWRGAEGAHPRVGGAQLGLSADRRRRSRSGRGRSAPAGMAGARLPGRHGLSCAAWHAAQPPGRAGAGHRVGDLRAPELSSADGARQRDGPGGRQPRDSCRAMRSGATTTRCCAIACRSWPTASSRRSDRSATGCSPTARR